MTLVEILLLTLVSTIVLFLLIWLVVVFVHGILSKIE